MKGEFGDEEGKGGRSQGQGRGEGQSQKSSLGTHRSQLRGVERRDV